MPVPLSLLSAYLRAGDEGLDPHTSFTIQPLLNRTIDQNTSDDDTHKPVKKVMIRIKSDNSADDSNDDYDEEESPVFQEDSLMCIYNHPYLSPRKPSAKALIRFICTIDFAFGAYLIARSFVQHRGEYEYGYLMSSLTAGLLLLGSSLSGMCSNTTFGKLFCGGDEAAKKSLMTFNMSFAFIAVGIYYVLGLSLLLIPLFSTIFIDSNGVNIGTQCSLSFLGFGLSVIEGYRIIFIHYHYYYYSDDDDDRRPTEESNPNSPAVM